jgi:hypothetical protein
MTLLKVEQLRPQVFHVYADSQRELGMLFLRYTEFYESKYDHIRGKQFTLVQQMSAYCREHLLSPDADWSYTTDWSGYNFPAETIRQVHDLGILDPNHYDSLMYGLHGMIEAETVGKPAYIIGTSCSSKQTTLDHELAHAMYYLNEDYRKWVGRILDFFTYRHLVAKLGSRLASQNYPSKVHADEIQAYITTGEGSIFDTVPEDPQETALLDELRSKLKAAFAHHFPSFMQAK